MTLPPAWLIKLAGALALLAGAWLHGRSVGAADVRAEWQAQQQQDRDAAEAQAETRRLQARSAATQYETRRAAIAARATQVSPEVRNALNAPICRPLGASAPGLRLGDVAVPAAVVGRLRDAGADY